MFSMSARPL